MKLSNYNPIFKWVLVQVVMEDKTAGGIYLPPSVMNSGDNLTHLVIKTGGECIKVQPGDKVKIDPRVATQTVMLEDGEGKRQEYYQIQEINIIGIERDDSVRVAPKRKSTVPRGSIV